MIDSKKCGYSSAGKNSLKKPPKKYHLGESDQLYFVFIYIILNNIVQPLNEKQSEQKSFLTNVHVLSS